MEKRSRSLPSILTGHCAVNVILPSGCRICRSLHCSKGERRQGKKVILWTCRCGDLLEEAVAWCRMFGLEFDAVNENVAQTLEQYGTESRKISADVYIDDKACWPWMTKQEWEQYLAG